MDRDEIMMALGPMTNQVRETERLRKKLAKQLQQSHPIHKKLGRLTDRELMKLSVSLFAKKINGRDRKLKAISDHFFQEFPDAPLRNLQRIMEEDAYFAKLLEGDVHAQPTGFFRFPYDNNPKGLVGLFCPFFHVF